MTKEDLIKELECQIRTASSYRSTVVARAYNRCLEWAKQLDNDRSEEMIEWIRNKLKRATRDRGDVAFLNGREWVCREFLGDFCSEFHIHRSNRCPHCGKVIDD